jgi:hypothetical protein
MVGNGKDVSSGVPLPAARDQTRSVRLAVLNLVFSQKRSIAEVKAEGQ